MTNTNLKLDEINSLVTKVLVKYGCNMEKCISRC